MTKRSQHFASILIFLPNIVSSSQSLLTDHKSKVDSLTALIASLVNPSNGSVCTKWSVSNMLFTHSTAIESEGGRRAWGEGEEWTREGEGGI